ncbi:MAG: hypothetical protein V4667_09320 [Bacteroidota bacterium]
MKKTILGIAILVSSTAVFAQNKNVVSAINYLGYYKKDKTPGDLKEAKNYIDLATEHAETKSSAKAWTKRGEIYYSIMDSKDPKVTELAPNALEEAYKAFMEAVKLDVKGNYPEAKDYLNRCAARATNTGVADFKAENYAGALNWFETAIKINDEGTKKIDTNLIYNAALAGDKAKNYDRAIVHYNRLLDYKYGGKDGGKYYSFLANVYREKKDDDNTLATIQRGRTAFPNDKNLILDELNYYLGKGKIKEAIANTDLAIEKEPTNHVLYYNKGVLFDNLANPAPEKAQPTEAEINDYFAKSEAAYKKAIEIKADYFDAQYNIGALYFNKAVKINDIAVNIKDQKKYDSEMKRVDDIFKQAIPYLEEADKLKAPDKETEKVLLQTLQKLYLMTDQPDKAKATKDRIGK